MLNSVVHIYFKTIQNKAQTENIFCQSYDYWLTRKLQELVFKIQNLSCRDKTLPLLLTWQAHRSVFWASLVYSATNTVLFLNRSILGIKSVPGRRIWANDIIWIGKYNRIWLNTNLIRKSVSFNCYHHTSDLQFSIFWDEQYFGMPKNFLVLRDIFMKTAARQRMQNSIL